MTSCSPGDVILVRFPFTDLSTAKRRPAVVLSPAEFAGRYGDVVVMALTSRKQEDDSLSLQHWKQAGLPKPTWFKPLIATIAGDIIVRRLGSLAREDVTRAAAALKFTVAAQFLSVE